jgi:hypothetical protein
MVNVKLNSVINAKKYTAYSSNNVVGIAIPYGLDGSGIESRRWRNFPAVQTGPQAYPSSCVRGTGSVLGNEHPAIEANHPSPSSAEVANGRSYAFTSPLCLQKQVTGRYFFLQFYVDCRSAHSALTLRYSRRIVSQGR